VLKNNSFILNVVAILLFEDILLFHAIVLTFVDNSMKQMFD